MNFNINPFSQQFLKAKNSLTDSNEEQMSRNSQGVSQEELQLIDATQNLYANTYYSPAGSFSSSQAAFRNIFSNKFQKIGIYREMSMFPEIVDALNKVCDEAITANEKGDYIKLRRKTY